MKKAELVLINGDIYSINEDNKRTSGEAIAVSDGFIKKIGSNEDVRGLIGSETKVVDCSGNTILPGLCDAHCHPSAAAGLYAGCDLFGIYIREGESSEEIIEKYIERLKKFVELHPDEKLIRGTGWVIGNFMTDRMPTRHDIDKICRDRPVILESFCQHNLWVNTRALEIAGINENTPEVYAGEIKRESTGYPSGLLREPEAIDLIKLNVPGYDFSVEKYKEAFLFYQREFANKYGVTMVQDCMHSNNAREAYKELAREGRLTCRAGGVYIAEPGNFKDLLSEYEHRKGKENVGDDFKMDTIKIFAEGGFVLDEPYEKAFNEANGYPADYRGTPFWSDEELIYTAQRAMEAGFNVHIHAMGDSSVRQAARCLEKAKAAAEKSGGKSECRNVIAHLMLADEESVDAMSRAGIIANCQPRWMVYDSDIEGMLPMVGKKRSEGAYPYRTFLNKNVRVAFGTDFPVTPPPDTMHEIQCVMTREVFPDAPDYEKFKGRILGSEKPAELREAVKSLSLNGAYQMGLDKITGSIEEGKSAELVILDSKLEDVPVKEIYSINVEKTIFKGKIVYER